MSSLRGMLILCRPSSHQRQKRFLVVLFQSEPIRENGPLVYLPLETSQCLLVLSGCLSYRLADRIKVDGILGLLKGFLDDLADLPPLATFLLIAIGPLPEELRLLS
jgi:hypothetical protein